MKKKIGFLSFHILLALLLVAGCSMNNHFAELESAEFLTDAQRQLDTTTPEWYIDYGQTTIYADYVQISPVTAVQAGTTDGLPAGYEDYIRRLSITNLIPNGDFESADISAWTTTTGTAVASRAAAPTPAQINTLGETLFSGSVLDFSIAIPATDRIELDLDSETPTDSFVSNGFYLIRFDFSDIGSGSKFFQLQGFANGNWFPDVTPNVIYSVPSDYAGLETHFETDTTTNIFTIGNTGGGGSMDGYMDNLRMLRTDIENRIVLEVPWSAGDNRPDLVSGYYRFSLYIKNIPTSELPANEFHAESVTLGISTSFGGLNSIYNQAVHQSNDTGVNWDEWTRVSVDSFLQIDEPTTDPTDTVIFLCITPTNKQIATFTDVGSILIAAPSLEYSSDGTF